MCYMLKEWEMWGIIHAQIGDSHMFKDTKQCKGSMDSVISINLGNCDLKILMQKKIHKFQFVKYMKLATGVVI